MAPTVWPGTGGIAASVVGTIAASPRNGAAIAAATRGGRAWARSAAPITDVTAPSAVHPPRCKDRPRRCDDQRHAQDGRDLEGVTAGRVGSPLRGLAESNG